MTTILTIIFIFGVLYEIFMISPFGVALMIKQLDDEKTNCCWSIIATIVIGIILIIISDYLGIWQ